MTENANHTRLALVIGATGGIGSAVAQELSRRNWRVRGFCRSPGKAPAMLEGNAKIEWVAGDAMALRDVTAAAQGASVIVHAANPPGYCRWRELALPMLENAVEAARVTQARLVLPGNIYNFGPQAFPVIAEGAPQEPQTVKGRVRVEMEQMLARAAEEGVRSVVLRAGDFFGPHQPGSWFGNALVKPGRPVRSVTYPGDRDVGHGWAYLPDLARAMVGLMEIEQGLAPHDTFHFGGHWLERGGDMADVILNVAGCPDGRVRRFPWWLLRVVSPAVPLFRELLEMRYLWQVPVRLDNSKLTALLGEEPHTPLEQAVEETLAAMGCLPERDMVPQAT